MLLYSPSWLYLVPGSFLLLLGLIGMVVLASGPAEVFGRTWQIHTMLGFVALTLIGAQVIQLGVFARTYARVQIGERDLLLDRLDAASGWSTASSPGGARLAIAGLVAIGTGGRSNAWRPQPCLRDGAPGDDARPRHAGDLRRLLSRPPDNAAPTRSRFAD